VFIVYPRTKYENLIEHKDFGPCVQQGLSDSYIVVKYPTKSTTMIPLPFLIRYL
jgi:hypothetical protein